MDLKKKGCKETTIIQNYGKVLKNIAKFSKLNNPDSVLVYIASKDISEGRRELMVDVYVGYCKWKNIPFFKPRYKRQDRLPYVPLEIDIEALLSALPRKLGILTRTLKETGARPGELCVDAKTSIVSLISLGFFNCWDRYHVRHTIKFFSCLDKARHH